MNNLEHKLKELYFSLTKKSEITPEFLALLDKFYAEHGEKSDDEQVQEWKKMIIESQDKGE